ncbi:hypothetical protein GCM10027422_40360 [Hymenobacter arcticus]
MLYGLALLLAGYAVVQGFFGADVYVRTAAAVLGGAGAVLLLLMALRTRLVIDLWQRRFVNQQFIGRQVLDFEEVGQILPVRLVLNGASRGIYYEAFPASAPNRQRGGLRISDTYPDEELAAEFYPAVQALLR